MLSIIIPIYNEEGAIEDIIQRVDMAIFGDYELIVVDDGSTDSTPDILRKINLHTIHVISHSKNLGNGAAIMTGAKHAQGEWVATIDADGTYFPEDIPRLLRAVQEENADMVTGMRGCLMKGPFFHKTARNVLRKLAEFAAHKPIADVNSGLRIVRKEIIERYASFYPHRFSFHIILTICASRDGYNVIYKPIRYGPRIGLSKLSSGLRGPYNFIKFLILILWIMIRKSPKPSNRGKIA